MEIKRQIRDSNIELLRIVFMLMIIMHHLISRGCGLNEMSTPETFQASSTTWIQILINSFIVCAVNGYVFISGYFGIKFNLKKLVLLITQALFYSFVLYILMSSLGYVDISLKEIAKSFFPITRSVWWFFNCFLALFILSPILNKGLSLLSKGQIISVLILLFYLGYIKFIPGNMVSGNGFSIYSFVFIYILANYCNRFQMSIKKPFFIYFFSSGIIFIMAYYCFVNNQIERAWSIFSYNNPFVLIAAVSLFFGFKKFKIQKKWINTVASFTFGIYLFHEIEYINPQLANIVKYIQNMGHSPTLFFTILFILAIMVFIIGMGIDKIRQMVCIPLIDYLFKRKISKKLVNYFGWKG